MDADGPIRRKPDDKRKTLTVRFRATEDERNRMQEAAERIGLDLSAWLRMVALQAATPQAVPGARRTPRSAVTDRGGAS